MLTAIIAPHARLDALARAVLAAGGTIVWTSSEPPIQALGHAARVATDILVLGPGTTTPDELTPALLRFRAARPSTRVILLAPGRQPGDPLVRQAAQAGIYDILAPASTDALPDKLTLALQRPPATIADAIRWLAPSEAHGDADQKRRPVAEVQVREVIRTLGPRAVRVAVFTAGGGPEGTDLAVALAHALASRGPRVTARLRLPVIGAAVAGEAGPARCVPAGDLPEPDTSVADDAVIEDLGEPDPATAPNYGHHVIAWPAVAHRAAQPLLQARRLRSLDLSFSDDYRRQVSLLTASVHVPWPPGRAAASFAQELLAALQDLNVEHARPHIVTLPVNRGDVHFGPLPDLLAPRGGRKTARLRGGTYRTSLLTFLQRVLLPGLALWCVAGLALSVAPLAFIPPWVRALFAVGLWNRLLTSL